MRYVTYDTTTGLLTGCFLQELQPEHSAHYIEIDEATATDWVHHKYNLTTGQLEAYTPVIAPVKPTIVTRRQARQALLLRGKLDAVQPAITAISDATQRGLAQIEWDDSLEFDRNRPILIQLGTAIGLDSAGLDDLFQFASTL